MAAGVRREARAGETASLDTFPRTLVEGALARVLAGEAFRRSRRHREFLSHVVAAALDGRDDRLREMAIGLEVFGRDAATYDPRADPIVRVEAGRIRRKLERHYESEGAADAHVLELPVGGYVPRLRHHPGDRRTGPARVAVAVLPLSNLTGHPEDDALAHGLADQLIDELGRSAHLKVVARASAFAARERETDRRRLGRLLGVTHVVEGSIQRSGPRLRCIVQVARTGDDVRLWSQRFEGRGDDPFVVQDAIADAVQAAVLALAADGDGAPRAAAARAGSTASVVARDLYERGRYVSSLRTLDGHLKAIELFERAIDADPRYGRAYSMLAYAWVHLLGFAERPSGPAIATMNAALARALAIDPLDGEAHALKAAIAYRFEFDWPRAQPLFRDAMRLAPSSPFAHISAAWALTFDSQFDEALRHARVAVELDPLSLNPRIGEAMVHGYAGDFDAAFAGLDAVLEVEPGHHFTHWISGAFRLWQRRPDDAARHFDELVRTIPGYPSAWFGKVAVAAQRGDAARARDELAALLARLDGRY